MCDFCCNIDDLLQKHEFYQKRAVNYYNQYRIITNDMDNFIDKISSVTLKMFLKETNLLYNMYESDLKKARYYIKLFHLRKENEQTE